MSPSPKKAASRRPAFAKAFVIGIIACMLPAAHAAVTVQFEQVGSNLVVTTTGNLNLTGLSQSWSAWELDDAYYRQIGADLPQDILRIFRDSVTCYEFSMGGSFFSEELPVRVADAYSGMTFGMWANSSLFALYVPRHFISGPITSSMTFYDLSLESVGVIEQVIQLGPSDGLRIKITVVPEPAILSMSALLMLGMTFKRTRQRHASVPHSSIA